MGLRQALLDGDKYGVKEALQCGWCWPHDPVNAARATALGSKEPSPPRPGECLLVSVNANTSSRLWRASPNMQKQTRGVARLAGDVADQAWHLTTRDLPVLVGANRLTEAPTWHARSLGFHGNAPQPESTLHGASYGLALTLASASLLLNRPLPTDLIALACVRSDGQLMEVEGLNAKLAVIVEWALGARRVMVAASQQEEASALLREANSDIAVETPASAGAAILAAFPNAVRIAGETWTDAEDAEAAVMTLYMQALRKGVPLVGWSGVAETAKLLAARFGNELEEPWRVHFVRSVALRHDSGRAPEVRIEPWPDSWLLKRPRPERLQLLAHLVQSHSDAASTTLDSILHQARSHLSPPHERHQEDIELLGALGRGHAVLAEPQLPPPESGSPCEAANTALDTLTEAIEGWRKLFLPEQASYAYCERLRLLGMLGRSKEARAEMETTGEWILKSPRTDMASRCFVAVAHGRALTQLGDADEALNWLSEERARWWRAQTHATTGRIRWHALALQRLGRVDEARRVRRQLLEGNYETQDENRLLAAIDEAVADGRDLDEPLQALESAAPGQVRSLVQGGDPNSTAKRLSAYWRY